MPYIKAVDRDNYDTDIESVIEFFQRTTCDTGDIPTLLCQTIKNILLGSYKKWLPNYADYNEIIGVLECSKLEFICRKGQEIDLNPEKYRLINKKINSALKRRTDRLVQSVLTWYENECTSTSGQLNYIITRLLILSQTQIANYINPVNILDHVKFDIYQNEIAPYENIKEQENGSVASAFIE